MLMLAVHGWEDSAVAERYSGPALLDKASTLAIGDDFAKLLKKAGNSEYLGRYPRH